MLTKNCYRIIHILVCCIAFFVHSYGQSPTHIPIFNSTIDSNINGYWEYLPRDYAADTEKRYPLLIFMHGAGAQGSIQDTATISKLLVYGPPKLIRDGRFPEEFSVGDETFRFIVLSPQIKNGIIGDSSIISPATIKAFIDYAKIQYRVDYSRIYLTGLSMGGGGIWDFAGSNPANAGSIAGIAIAAGAGKLSPQEAGIIAQSDIHVLAGHNIPDNIIEVQRTINNINTLVTSQPQIEPAAYYWDNPGTANELHNAWSRMFEDLDPGSTEGGNLTDSLGSNIYEWLLQFSTIGQAPVPVKWEDFFVDVQQDEILLNWIVSEQINVSRYEVQRSADGTSWDAIGSVFAKPGTGKLNYVYRDGNPVPGNNFYRIREVDEDGKYTYSKILKIEFFNQQKKAVSIYPSPFRSSINIRLSNSSLNRIQIMILDASGKIIDRKYHQPVSGTEIITWNNLDKLAPGVYQVQIQDKHSVIFNYRIMKQ